MKINISNTPLANVIALINATNAGLNLTEAQVTLGVPAVRTPDADPSNTSLLVTAVEDQGFSGTKTITYVRLGLDKGVAVAPGTVEVAADDDEAASLAKVIAAYGLVASEVTGDNYVAPVSENEPGSIVLVANVNSLLYFGPGVPVTLTVPDADVPLEDAIAISQQDGFEPA